MSSPIIIHPCFQECQDYTLDQFWKDIFFAGACNKFPRGVRYDGSSGTLFVRTPGTGGRTKVEAIVLPEKSDKMYLALIHVFREKLGMFSSRDLQIKKDEFEEIQAQRLVDMNCEWKKLKPRAIKDFMIMSYVSSMRKIHDMSLKDAKKLLSTIQLGFQLKKLNSEDVNYSDRAIQSINGLEYNSSSKEWIITNAPRSVSKSDKIASTQKFYQSVDRFVREYKARRLIN